MTTEKEVELMRLRIDLLNLNTTQMLIEGKINMLENEPIIDEGCVGCCKVVDIAAGLQKELDATREMYFAGQKYTIKQYESAIEELKDRNIDDLNELYKLDKEELDRLKQVISARDLSIKSLTTMCQSSGSIRNDLTKTIEGLEAELTEKRNKINTLHNLIKNIADELSARKEDSEVLKKVIEVRDDWGKAHDTVQVHQAAMYKISDLTAAYTDAPEGPPETPIDEPQEVTVTFAFLELP